MTKIPQCLDCGTRLSQEPWAPELCPRCSLQLALEHSPVEMDGVGDPEALPTREFPGQSFSPGQILGSRFQIRSLLGRGGMGEVWRAYDLKLRVDVALKTLRAEILEKERALQALRQEVRSAREVISPNVCRVFDLVELDGQELVSMEYIDGTTLVKVLQSRGPLELQEAREIASQFLAGLEAIHQAGLVHRDLKPENVMITRSGRVVVMDFGIAKGLADRKTGTVSGTPAYMAPEQARGEEVDARADVFSAGVVLAEMIAPSGTRTHTAREAIWQGIHHEPPELPDSPWEPVLTKAVARLAAQRYPTAAALARALEEITLQVEGAEDVRPYPGLASFTEEDAEYFFGRELEVEAMWKKLRRPHLLGLIGPSGAGKSSFLRAGLIPAMPQGWRCVICSPGVSPFAALAQALFSEFSGDTDAMRQLLRFEEIDIALSIVARWKKRHAQVIVIVDQFEELFTLCPQEVQSRFAELLGRMVLEADVQVLLSMRDDFLSHCTHPVLAPLFSELTPLHPLTDAALRRALVQPALKCGYRFEEEALAEEMIAEVSEERGALPLLAFAASRLWYYRDRKQGLLTKEAYQHIGGVGGALAQHAEATLEKIGNDRIPVVREIFRNLVTAQGTRATREMEELLSVFEDKDAAREVLRELVDARLLTTYDIQAAEDEESSQTRIEIIHESLLKAWPRLVRWQAQDAEGALLRDQLRQQAHLWQERGRPVDLLWTGTSYNEFKIWRDRYSGGLTSNEEDFAQAMIHQAERRRRRRRFATTAAFVVLFGVVGVVSTLWRQAERAHRLSEASKLLALGQLVLDDYPTASVAYSIASLEVADTPEAREFAMKALWRGPTAFIMPTPDTPDFEVNAMYVDFSPDGEWFALAGYPGNGLLWSADGQTYKHVARHVGDVGWPKIRFGQHSDLLLSGGGKTIKFWSVPKGSELRALEFGRNTWFEPVGSQLFTFTAVGEGSTEGESRVLVQSRPLEGGEPRDLRYFEAGAVMKTPDPTGKWLAYKMGRDLYVVPVKEMSTVSPRLIGRHEEWILALAWASDGERIASRSISGEIRIWSLSPGSMAPLRVLEESDNERHPWGSLSLGRDGSLLVARSTTTVKTWDLTGPPDSAPISLKRSDVNRTLGHAFHPSGQWLAVGYMTTVAFWPLKRSYPYVLGKQNFVWDILFTTDGNWLASNSGGKLRLLPLSIDAGTESRILLDGGLGSMPQIQLDAVNRRLLVAGDSGRLWLVPLDGGQPRALMTGFTERVMAVALGPQGRLVATSISRGPAEEKVIRVLDLESGEVQVLGPTEGAGDGVEGTIWDLEFTPDGRLVSAGQHELLLWNLNDESAEVLDRGPWGIEAMMKLSPDGRFVAFSSAKVETSKRALKLYDLDEGTSHIIGDSVSSVAFDPTGELIVTGSSNGEIRVGPVTGEEAHLLLGHEATVHRLAVSPDGRWLASGSTHGTIRIWPMPNMYEPPFHTLPYEELLECLRGLTNLRAVPEEGSSTGYTIEIGPFPGWEKVPVW